MQQSAQTANKHHKAINDGKHHSNKRCNKYHSNKRCRQHSKRLLHQGNRLRKGLIAHANQAVQDQLKTATIMASIGAKRLPAATIPLETKNALLTASVLNRGLAGNAKSHWLQTVGT